MEIKKFVVGPLFTNAYLLVAGGEAALIDPGGTSVPLERALASVKLRYILLTHGHFDHADYAELFRARTGAPILYHPEERTTFWAMGRTPPPLDRALQDGDRLPLGEEELLVWHLPGHSPGSLAFLWERQKTAFVGDVLFAGSVGRTDLPGGSWEELSRSLARLLALGEGWRILPGHGPATELAHERAHNPFLRELAHGRA
ncbi:MAG: MBL fold metallo-hydrolase [Candidatus Bipolaricaulota bacterium]|nr:MBL fold metallo-hydrolase [Candidatus Bipolaricaulota bacterium]MCX7844414.1 MBL fold metallo-hydrolase [Candidatus Bipolaricaulota bacterium]MDW8151579.1 MBL fold metallo-hydrolase [Candidatus Bipolaricaulota bacterium]